jgi:hypothetical protein
LIEAAKEADQFAQALSSAVRDKGLVQALTSTRVEDRGRRIEIGALLTELGSWLDRVGRLSSAVVQLKLDERRVALAEREGQLLERAIRAILAGMLGRVREVLDVMPEALVIEQEWPGWVSEVVPRELREIAKVAGDG